ncbi:ABC-type spermidine/putrescine transport system permease subunit II [Bradyrhizobium sp. S3.3.6]
MGDIQFLVLIATIILCTAYVANVVYLAGKAIREQVVHSANMIRESRHLAE